MSILYDFECKHCGTSEERFIPMSERDEQKCSQCGNSLSRLLVAKPEPAFTPHFSSALGIYVESRKQRDNELKSIYKRSFAKQGESV